MTVSITLVRTLLEEVARAGRDPDALLATAGVERTLLADPDARIDLDPYNRLDELAIDVIGDAALGLHMAERAPLATFHVVGVLSTYCRTLREALEAFIRFRKLLSECEPPSLIEEGERATLVYTFMRGSERVNRLRAELGTVSVAKVGGLFGMNPPLEVTFEHAAPAYAAEYARIFGCPIRFDAGRTCLSFERRLLDQPQPHPNSELSSLLAQQAERKLARLDGQQPMAERVRALVLTQYGGAQTMATVARDLGLSVRSLRRRLQDEGHSYAEVVGAVLADHARALLADPSLTIQAVADRLGFSEPSAFHRAFKRWTGLTPHQFRAHRVGAQRRA
jgi:AraC-like DNA-binding protein